jgi:hypothetical protein
MDRKHTPIVLRTGRRLLVVIVSLSLFVALFLAAWGALACGSKKPAPGVSGGAAVGFDHQHQAWTELLEKYVRHGRVDYAGWKAADLEALDSYLAQLAAVTKQEHQQWSSDQRLAFWINTYNAYMVHRVLKQYPINSVKTATLIPFAVFKKRFIPSGIVEGTKLSLDAVEHQIIRKRFDEPRIHFALVCAAVSCPSLRGEAYRGADLGSQLDDQGHGFLGDSAKNRYNAGQNKLYLSKIFDWFKGDFRQSAGSVKAFVAPYLPDDARQALESGKARISYLKYDWSLNDV